MNKTMTVLLVDDSPYDRAMVARELKKEFDDVCLLEATNHVEYAELLEDAAFDLVITDYQIRWTDGLRVLHDVKQRKPQCPVLMFTATGSEEIAVRAMKAGLDDYILKNLPHMNRLRSAARSALEHAETRVRADQMELRFGSLMSHLKVGVFRRDLEGTVIEANDATAVMLGEASGADVVGKKLWDYLDRLETIDDETASPGPEFAGIRSDGSLVWLSVSESRAMSAAGAPVFDGLLEDISLRKQAEADVNRLQEEMARADRINIMAEMAAGISHQLNQPLTVITSFASICADRLGDGKESPEQLRQWMNQIHDLALESAQVVRGLNEFTRHRPRNPESTDMCELIRSTLETLKYELRQAKIQTEFHVSDESIQLIVDRIQLRQVLMNLVKASVGAMSDTAAEDRMLTLSVSTDDDAVTLTLAHTGDHIPEDQIAGLFKPYAISENRGSTIGLSISARILQAHNGTVTAHNNADRGATFHVTLPALPWSTETAAVVQETESPL